MKQEYIYIFFISVIAILSIYYLFNITENFQDPEENPCADAFKDVYDREANQTCNTRITKALKYSSGDKGKYYNDTTKQYEPYRFSNVSPCTHKYQLGVDYDNAGLLNKPAILNKTLNADIIAIAGECKELESSSDNKSTFLTQSCVDSVKSNIDIINEETPLDSSCTKKVKDAMELDTNGCIFSKDDAELYYNMDEFIPFKSDFEKYCNDTYQQKAIPEACKTKIKEKIDNKIGKNPYGICEDYFTNSLIDSKDDPECNYTDSNVDFIDGETEGYFYDTKQGMIQGCGSNSDTKKESCRTALETQIKEQSRISTVESRQLKANGDLSINCANIYNPLGYNASSGQYPDCAGYDSGVYSTVNFTSMIDEFKTAGICENEPYDSSTNQSTGSTPNNTSPPVNGSTTTTTTTTPAPTTTIAPQTIYVTTNGSSSVSLESLPLEDQKKYIDAQLQQTLNNIEEKKNQLNELYENYKKIAYLIQKNFKDNLRNISKGLPSITLYHSDGTSFDSKEEIDKAIDEDRIDDAKRLMRRVVDQLSEEEKPALRAIATISTQHKKAIENLDKRFTPLITKAASKIKLSNKVKKQVESITSS